MKKLEATNTFQEGIVMDFNPLVTPNNVVTNCLNGTLITYNGNENVLLNDMGNGRVETAFLPEGYVPLGTAELGGIIYIVSYNPLINKCLIGSFPSPERNLSLDEVGEHEDVLFTLTEFIDENHVIKTPIIKKALSSNIILYPGDKFLVTGNSISDNASTISGYENNEFKYRFIDFKLATIDNNGRFIYLSDLKKYKIGDNQFHIKNANSDDTKLDDYRENIASDYHIFTSKVAGNLYIVGLLEVIDSISSFTYKVKSISSEEPTDDNKVIIDNDGRWYEIEYNILSSSASSNKMNHVIFRTGELELYLDYNGNKITNNLPPETDTDSITPTIFYKASSGQTDITMIPCMKFGKLEYLKESITLDFDLLGTDLVINTLWKYWLDESGMIIKFDLHNYFISNEIKSVSVEFLDYEKMLSNSPNIWNTKSNKTEDILNKKSYSGIHILEIPFDNKFIKNHLYGVKIRIKMNEELNNNSINKANDIFIYHYLYTNGVFNQYFLDTDENHQNFDNVKLPLKPIINFNNLENSIVLKSSNILESDSLMTYIEETNGFIKGYTLYTAKGEKNITAKVKLENTYNDTFSVTGTSVTISPKTSETAIVDYDKNEIINTSSSTINEQYLNPETSDDKINIYLNNNKIVYDIDVKSPISSSIVPREVSVMNYYAPLLNTPNDFYKYSLEPTTEIDENGVELLTKVSMRMDTLPAVGISSGGIDNKGGGGIMYVSGVASISKPNNGLFTITGTADSLFGESGPGKFGIRVFPNDDIDRAINSVSEGCSIVPVVLMNAGTSKVKCGGVLYSFIYGLDRDNTDNYRVLWFNDPEYLSKKLTYLLFIKDKMTDHYIPINWFMVADATSNDIFIKDGQVRYLTLLHSLYAKRPFTDPITVYTVGDISYKNKYLVATLDVKATVYKNMLNTKFNGKQLGSELLAYLTILNSTCNCFALDLESTHSIEDSLVFKFKIENKYIDEFLEFQNSVSIPNFVAGGKIKAPTNISSLGLYINAAYRDLDSNQLLIPIPNERDIILIESFKYTTDISGTTIIEKNKIGINNPKFINLNILSYDFRNDMLNIASIKLNKSLKLEWQSSNEGDGGATLMSSLGLCTFDYINQSLNLF